MKTKSERHSQVVNKARQNFQDGNLSRVWNNQSGSGWTGKVVKKGGYTILTKIRKVFYGIPEPKGRGGNSGGCDLLGYTVMNEKQVLEFVKKNGKVAVFTGIEGKSGNGKLMPNQVNFKNLLDNSGAIHYLAKECPSCIGEGCDDCCDKGFEYE